MGSRLADLTLDHCTRFRCVHCSRRHSPKLALVARWCLVYYLFCPSNKSVSLLLRCEANGTQHSSGEWMSLTICVVCNFRVVDRNWIGQVMVALCDSARRYWFSGRCITGAAIVNGRKASFFTNFVSSLLSAFAFASVSTSSFNCDMPRWNCFKNNSCDILEVVLPYTLPWKCHACPFVDYLSTRSTL